jgi:two-component system, cell cycle response regulator
MQNENPKYCRESSRGQPKETLQSLLSSALRSEDKELDQILCALEEISAIAESSAPDADTVRDALRRAASCAVKQALLDRELRDLAITDELTGLYNRRGFWASATQQLKVAHRNAQDLLLFFCDVDDLKKTNDTYGHPAGDQALVHVAGALELTFRESDLLARFGGDEFAVLASETGRNQELILSRLKENLEKTSVNESLGAPSLSVGVVWFNPKCPISLGELMVRADRAMYEDKVGRRKSYYPFVLP